MQHNIDFNPHKLLAGLRGLDLVEMTNYLQFQAPWKISADSRGLDGVEAQIGVADHGGGSSKIT